MSETRPNSVTGSNESLNQELGGDIEICNEIDGVIINRDESNSNLRVIALSFRVRPKFCFYVFFSFHLFKKSNCVFLSPLKLFSFFRDKTLWFGIEEL